MPRALTLSVALAAIGLIAAAPASAAEDRKEVKTWVKITRVHSRIVSRDGNPPYALYVVKGVVRSPKAGCVYGRRVKLIHHPGFAFTELDLPNAVKRFLLSWRDRTFPFTQQHERVIVARRHSRSLPGSDAPDGRFTCKGDRSRRFTIPPPSEAGIAAAAPEQRKSVFRAGLRLGLRSG